MKISTIIPIYNAEHTLPRCIDGFIAQTFKDFELILVNDGSTDRSLSICRQYAAQHPFIHVVDQPNGGVSAARNAGMDVAQGTYLSFTDADDEVSPHFLETFVEACAHHDFVMQSIMQTDGSSPIETVTLNDEVYEGADRMAELLLHIHALDIPISIWSSLFSHRIITDHQLRFDPRIAVCEDVDFILRYLLHCRSAHTTPKANYLYHTPADTKTYNERNPLRTSLKLLGEAYQLTESPSLRKGFRRCYLNWCIDSLLHLQQGEDAIPLATQFGILCQPYLGESTNTSFHHRLFRTLSISPHPRAILWAAETSRKLYDLLKKSPLRHFSHQK